MKYLLITLIVITSYSVYVDGYYIGRCNSVDTELLEHYEFIKDNGKYISTYAKYDKYNKYCGEGIIILDPSPCWVSLEDI